MAPIILQDFAHQYCDDDGKPLPLGLIYTYATGTSDLVAVFSDSDRTIEWSNPIELDSAGRIPAPGTIYPPDSPALDIYITNGVPPDDVGVYGPYGPISPAEPVV